MSSVALPKPFKNVGPNSINDPIIQAMCRRFHPTDWPTPVVRRLFDIPDPLPTGDPLPVGTVPPDDAGSLGPPQEDKSLHYLKEALDKYYESGCSLKNFMAVLHIFIHWLNYVRRPFGHTLRGVALYIFDKQYSFELPFILAHTQMPFLAFIDEQARLAHRTVPLVGKWEGLRLKEAENGLCGHDFAVLLAMAQTQRFDYDVIKDTYKVHIMYISSQGSPPDTAIIVTAIIPKKILEGLEEGDATTVTMDGIKFTRNTVQLPRSNQTLQECLVLKTLVFIIDEQFKSLDRFIPKQCRVGKKYSYIYDYSSPSH